jgi:hypothetical protein
MSARAWGAAGVVLALLAAMTTAASAGTDGGGPRQAIGLPAYWSPETPDGMAQFEEVSFATPTVDMVVVNGPVSAPPEPFSPATARAIWLLHREGATVLGYVDTGYLGRTGMTTTRVNPGSTEVADWREQMRVDAATWYRLYGRFGLAGVFFDQTLSDCGADDEHVELYGQVGREVQRRARGAIVAINPGTSVPECYADVADVIVIFENTLDEYRRWEPPAWVHSHPETLFWHLIHDVATVAEMRETVALSRERNAGFVYATSHTITADASPWNALPDEEFWRAHLRAVAAR